MVIEGTKEEFNAYNWCLACEYYNAIIGEDFASLGECLNNLRIWKDFIGDVCNWLNYDGEIGKDIEDDLEKLRDGTIITCNDRTFIQACYEHGWHELADGLSKTLKDRNKLGKQYILNR